MLPNRRFFPPELLATLCFLPALLTSVATTARAQCTFGSGGSIEIVADSDGSVYEAQFEVGLARDVFIVARPSGAAAGGLFIAEFGVDGLPEGWTATLVPNPAINVSLGDPFAPEPQRGATLSFGNCMQPDKKGLIPLYRVTITANSAVQDVRLRVVAADAASHACYATPILCGCECALTMYRLEATGGEFCVNPSETGCQVGVDRATWSRMRTLFR